MERLGLSDLGIPFSFLAGVASFLGDAATSFLGDTCSLSLAHGGVRMEGEDVGEVEGEGEEERGSTGRGDRGDEAFMARRGEEEGMDTPKRGEEEEVEGEK